MWRLTWTWRQKFYLHFHTACVFTIFNLLLVLCIFISLVVEVCGLPFNFGTKEILEHQNIFQIISK